MKKQVSLWRFVAGQIVGIGIAMLLIILAGCNDIKYGGRLDNYQDSALHWLEKRNCYYRCNNIDSFYIADDIFMVFRDSSKKYYKLIYPNDTAQYAGGSFDYGKCDCP